MNHPVLIPLTRGLFATVDAADAKAVRQYSWSARPGTRSGVWYAQAEIGGRTVGMHAFLVPPPDGLEVDHKDGDGLNNRRTNLRVCTRSQNNCNRAKARNCSSRFKGVSWFKLVSRWRARISLNGQHFLLGYFADEIEAAKAYNRAAKRLHKEFARLNVIPPTPNPA